ncbi:MAG: hypothetical protein AAB565_00200 [Patescibacteria group bacterium]
MKQEILYPYEYWGITVLPGHTQMALEEFLIRRVANLSEKAGQSRAAVRFYSFPQDTVVLGYGQDVDAVKKEDSSFLVTRRVTGGSHIQTGVNTMAYTFVVPRDGNFDNYEQMRSYYAGIVALSLKKIGIGAIDIDNKASIITVKGRIIASHAMFWGVQSALFHGLIILQPPDVDKIAERVVLQKRQIGNVFYSEYSALKNLPALSRELETKLVRSLLEPPMIYRVVADAILKEATGNRYQEKRIGKETISQALDLMSKKFSSPQWIKERKPPYTKDEVEEIPGEELAGPLKRDLGYCLFIQVQDDDFKNMANPEEEFAR